MIPGIYLIDPYRHTTNHLQGIHVIQATLPSAARQMVHPPDPQGPGRDRVIR